MIIVVSDTSPIRALGNLGLLSILKPLYGQIIIPRAVALELSQPREGQLTISLDDLGKVPGVEIMPIGDSPLLSRLLERLDLGESEAIALAIEIRADLILIDEAAGRSAARNEGLNVIGVLGVLLEAKRQGLVESIAPLVDQLQGRFQFFMSERLLRQILHAAGE